MKNILLINSSNRPSNVLINLFDKLNNEDFSLFLFSYNKNLIRQFKSKIKKNKLTYFGPSIKSNKDMVLFFAILPFVWLKEMIVLIYFKKKHKIDTIVCVESKEKIIFTGIANILKMRVIWIEKPSIKNKELIIKTLKLLSKKVKIITFLKADKKRLQENFDKKNIKNISIGIKDFSSKYQDSIFSSIAKTTNAQSYHNRFSVGVFLDKNKIYQSEILFKAVKICLSRFCNLRLIVIGDEIVRKKAMWMAKQADIGEVTCFVGDVNGIKKVQKSIDVFFALDYSLKLVDLSRFLIATMLKIPIVAFQSGLLKEFIIDGKNGVLVSGNSSEEIADILIKLQKNNNFRDNLKNNAYLYTQENFSFEQQFTKFKEELIS